MINKDVRKYLARKKGNENPIWSWNDSDNKNVMVCINTVNSPVKMETTKEIVLLFVAVC